MRRFNQWLLLPMLVALTILTAGFADSGRRYDDLGHEMMCACGCGQVLIECNHMGCPDSGPMLAELRTAIQRGDSDNTILTAFQNKYGPTILAAPMLTKFNIVAWVIPPALLLIGIGATLMLVRKWKLRTVPMPNVPQEPAFRTLRDRIRRETEL
ncbi:cytochrome c-type biogenesis protein [Paracidobacterium acidisoli]|uniref:Cytochrome c-type biogenesis protein n=1 Tax=Paracidobacterium acidisoli TaxID=2303751 RepID=A0A372ITI8_9BACT|nr:cytochrome c-type biogenesis protein CcmH [Paracidobacterium acidisoli]MBT9329688.1 cytochrome c-type biogenesis protein CcmH [Paracidobacterium acidisoli]